jgi:hypothetical protein
LLSAVCWQRPLFVDLSGVRIEISGQARSEIKVSPIDLRVARVPIGIVTLKYRTLNPVTRIVIEHAREVAKAAAKG